MPVHKVVHAAPAPTRTSLLKGAISVSLTGIIVVCLVDLAMAIYFRKQPFIVSSFFRVKQSSHRYGSDEL